VNLTGFDVKDFLKNSTRDGQVAGRNLPNIAFSLSGGGNRALLYAASIMDAFDSRNPQANEARTGGVLQLANFASGLSA
jgi:lysophospholipase